LSRQDGLDGEERRKGIKFGILWIHGVKIRRER
jgi:hypothetical protein